MIAEITDDLRKPSALPNFSLVTEISLIEKSDQKLQTILDALKQEFNPTQIFLFGSQANQQAHLNSDYDFVVVVRETQKSRIENMRIARALVRKVAGVSADVFVYDQKEFDEYKNELSSIPETALNTGRELDLG